MAQIFIRVHSPLFFCHFLFKLLQVRLLMQFTTFKSLFTPNVQIRISLSLLNCDLFTLSVQILITLSLSNCVLDMLGIQILVILSLFNCDLVTLGVQILVMAPKIYVHALTTGSATVNIYYLRCIVDFIVLLFYGMGCVDGSGSLSGGALTS